MREEAKVSLSDVTTQGSELTTLALTREEFEAFQKLRAVFAAHVDVGAAKATTWTWDELEEYLLAPNVRIGEHRSGLAQSTVEKTLKDLRALARHREAPVDLWPPREATWCEHVRYRTAVERAPETVLENRRRALRHLLAFLGVEPWKSLRKPFWKCPRAPRAIPSEAMVPVFWAKETRLHPDLLQDRNLKYTLRFLFLSGLRVSDLCALRVQDVHLEEGWILVTEPKKRGKQRRLYLEPHVLIAKNEKSLANYLRGVRPSLLVEPTDALFLSMEGKPWQSKVLLQKLSRAGKRVWPDFTPHCTRHRYATSLLRAEYRATENWNVGMVARRLGDESRTVERYYLDPAETEELAREGASHVRRPRRDSVGR